MIRIVQAAAWYPPYNIGGTETYLTGLVAALRSRGIESTVLVPGSGNMPDRYEHEGTSVQAYPVNAVGEWAEIREDRPHAEFEQFKDLLAGHRGAIYHQHSWTRGCGLHHLRAAKELGLQTVLTVHVPGNICQRGTMMRFGRSACEGVTDETTCAACWAQSRDMPEPVAKIVATLPLAGAQWVRGRSGGRLANALGARAIAHEKLGNVSTMIRSADRIVAVSGWLSSALAAHGTPREKLVMSRQGLSDDDIATLTAARAARRTLRGPLKLLYVGRCHSVKGIHLAVAAVRTLPSGCPVELAVHAPVQNDEEADYAKRLRGLAGNDPRIRFGETVSRRDLGKVMSEHDALVVPSTWLETGPLVVLEAIAAGLFVVGSRLGGIAELVDEPQTGLLVDGDERAWSAVIEQMASRLPERPRSQPPAEIRSMSTVAAEMASVYRSITGPAEFGGVARAG